jgi:hypothetical protein
VAENFLQVKEKVQRWLTDTAGTVDLAPNGRLGFNYESTHLVVDVIDQDDRVLVKVAAPIAFGVSTSPELFEWLARHCGDHFFGSFEIFDDDDGGTVTFGIYYTLLGDYLDPAELSAAVSAVAGAADELDDDVTKQFGGRRYTDLGD